MQSLPWRKLQFFQVTAPCSAGRNAATTYWSNYSFLQKHVDLTVRVANAALNASRSLKSSGPKRAYQFIALAQSTRLASGCAATNGMKTAGRNVVAESTFLFSEQKPRLGYEKRSHLPLHCRSDLGCRGCAQG